ncbi:MAG: AraC family transcriptional regulator [Maritimibacter sp.]|nr:AraC family transcriptional regulator [Maritimibacter sp.]
MTELTAPEIVDSPGQRFVGLVESYDMTSRVEIPALYQRFAALRDGIDGARPDALYGLSFDAREDGNFRYAVALEVPEPAAQPDGVRVITSAPGAYAVFRQRTPVAELPARFDAIFAHWLPAAPYTQREGAVFERYPDDDAPEDGKMLYEIWVPVTADETRNAARTGT